MALDPVQMNVDGVRQLVGSNLNKITSTMGDGEGPQGEEQDVLSLKTEDKVLLEYARRWEADYRGYEAKIKPRQDMNVAYYKGRQRSSEGDDHHAVVPSNIIFEATEDFIAAALAKNPGPVVYPASPNPIGNQIAKDLKTMLQYHSDVLVLKRKLGMMVRHWNSYFLGVVKHGWDAQVGDISLDVVFPQNLILDKDGTIDVYGNYTGKYLGERKKSTAQELIDLFTDEKNPESSLSAEKKAYIHASVDGHLGTEVSYTEWWTNEYCFYTYKDMVLDKHKNQFWNYGVTSTEINPITGLEEDQEIEGKNHFGRPKMPYTFLAVFTMGKHPHDVTSLIEQSIPNQDLINKRIDQIDKNLDVSNNSLAVSAENFNNETAKQAADAITAGRPIMVPRGKAISEAITRLPASNFPGDAFDQLQDITQRLRSVYGTLGISAAGTQQEETVRGKIMGAQQDSSRIGGGIGDALEQVADNIFNWFVQEYMVFYDDEHFAAVMGKLKAAEFVTLRASDLTERMIVSVAPNSMKPRDEVTEMNQAIDLWNAKALDPLSLFERLNDTDPKDTASRVVMWTTNPLQYAAIYTPEVAPQAQPMQGAGVEQNVPADTGGDLSAPPANASLSNVPINNLGMPQ